MSTALKRIAGVEPLEIRAVLIAFVYFFFLMASYFILRPLRDTMGTIYGVDHLQELFTGTFIVSFVVAPVYAGFASRIRLATFLPRGPSQPSRAAAPSTPPTLSGTSFS